MLFSFNVFNKNKKNAASKAQSRTKSRVDSDLAKETKHIPRYTSDTEFFAKNISLQNQSNFPMYQKYINSLINQKLLMIGFQGFLKSFIVIINYKTYKIVRTFTFHKKVMSKFILISNKEGQKFIIASFIDGDLVRFPILANAVKSSNTNTITEKISANKVLDIVYMSDDQTLICCGEFVGLILVRSKDLKIQDKLFESLHVSFQQISLARSDTLLLAKAMDGKIWILDVKQRCVSGKIPDNDFQLGFKIIDTYGDGGVAVNFVSSQRLNLWSLKYEHGGYNYNLKMGEIEGSTRSTAYWQKYDLIGVRNDEGDAVLFYDMKNMTLINELSSKLGPIFKTFCKLDEKGFIAFDETRRKIFYFNVKAFRKQK